MGGLSIERGWVMNSQAIDVLVINLSSCQGVAIPEELFLCAALNKGFGVLLQNFACHPT